MSSLMLGNDDSVGGILVYFAGEMDEVRAYNRALSEPEALGEYRGDRSANPPGLAGWWDFNEPDGVLLRDRSGNRNDGTLDDPSAAARMRVALPDRPQGPGITGDFPVTVRVEDGRGGSDEQTFTLHVTADQPASVSGTLYNDQNADGTRQAEELGLADWMVYVDENENGLAEPWEQTATTAADGSYSFAGLTPGSHRIGVVGKTGWQSTFANCDVLLSSGQILADIDLGETTVGVDTAPRAPAFVSTPPTSASAGQPFRYQPAVRNADARPLTFDVVLGPDGLAIDALTGAVGWRPTANQAGANRILLRVQDDRGLVAIQDFTISVAAAPSAPVITSDPPDQAVVGVAYHYQVRAQDADGGPLAFALAVAPTGMLIDPTTGLVSWIPDIAQQPTAQVTVRVTDPTGLGAEQSFTLAVAADATNIAPVITSTPRTSAALGLPYVYRAEAADPNGDLVTYSLTTAPAGMTIDASTGLVQWMPTADQLGDQTVTVQADDGRGGTDAQSLTIAVRSQPTNQPPRFTSVPPTAAAVDALFAYDALVLDPDNDPVQFLLDNAPAGMSIDPDDGTVRWQPPLDFRGDVPVTIRAIDPLGGEAIQAFTLAVGSADQPPTITSIPPTLAGVGRQYSYGVSAADPYDRVLLFSLTAAPVGMTIDPATGVITWTPDATQLGSQTVAVRVENPVGGSSRPDIRCGGHGEWATALAGHYVDASGVGDRRSRVRVPGDGDRSGGAGAAVRIARRPGGHVDRPDLRRSGLASDNRRYRDHTGGHRGRQSGAELPRCSNSCSRCCPPITHRRSPPIRRGIRRPADSTATI